MCMEDVRIGRRSVTTMENVVVTTTAKIAIPPDPHRLSLVIGPTVSGNCTLSLNPGVPNSYGFPLGTSTAPLVLSLQQHGDIVTRGWHAVSSMGGAVFSYAASSLAEE